MEGLLQRLINAVIAGLNSIVDSITEFAKWIKGFLESILNWVLELVDKIFDIVLLLPQLFFQWVGEGVVEFFNWLPVPGFISGASDMFSSIPADIAFYGSALQIGPGIAMVLSAYVLRFILRRIPFIG